MFTLGSDPEVLLVNTDGKLIASVGLVGGTKVRPQRTPHGYVQEDNVLVEFNTEPAKSESSFVENTLNMIQDINDIIVPLDLSVKIESSGLFDRDQLITRQAKVAGCEPDYDAWELRENQPPNLAATQLRTCGGHLHIGFEESEEDSMNRTHLVRIMDLIAGVPSVLMDGDVDRRSLYGKAGAHRPKYVINGDSYNGVEYRTLSNFWISSKEHIAWAYRTVERSLTEFQSLQEIAVHNKDAITATINNSDTNLAQDLVHEFNLEVVCTN